MNQQRERDLVKVLVREPVAGERRAPGEQLVEGMLLEVGGGETGLPELSEVFHNWNVGADLPYSCGVQGSCRGADCHYNQYTQFTVTDAQNIIPFIRSQHSEWGSLPPFNNQPQVAVSAHSTMSVVDYRVLWQEIAWADSDGKR